jgi:hypothetical protein
MFRAGAELQFFTRSARVAVLVCRSHARKQFWPGPCLSSDRARNSPTGLSPGARPLFSCSRCFYLPRSLVSASAPRARPDVRPVVRSAAATASSCFFFAVPSIFWAAIGSREELAKKNMFLSLAPVCCLVLALSLALVIAVNHQFQVIHFSVDCYR